MIYCFVTDVFLHKHTKGIVLMNIVGATRSELRTSQTTLQQKDHFAVTCYGPTSNILVNNYLQGAS